VFSFFLNPKERYLRAVLKQGPDPRVAALPQISKNFIQSAELIYERILRGQFSDYEERYGGGLLAKINEEKKGQLIHGVTNFMLYAFFCKIEEEGSVVASPLTHALHFEIYKTVPTNDSSFLTYVTYQNHNFEEKRLAAAFKFGNDISNIMETADRPFSFMGSQQAMIISEVTRRVLADTLTNNSPTPATDPAQTNAPKKGDTFLAAKYWCWWFAWGVFSAIMLLIVLAGMGIDLKLSLQAALVIGTGVVSGSVALILYKRR
jgi:hypothetical protein